MSPARQAGLSRRSFVTRGLAAAGGTIVTAPLLGAAPAGAAAPARPAARAARTKAAGPVTTPDYLGYRRADYAKPYAKYYTETVRKVQPQILAALFAGQTPAADVPALADLPAEINTRGYSKVESGYAIFPDGTEWYAGLTKMPGVRPEMWDWWFGWHSAEPARYKLWHPEAHLYASLETNLADEPGLTDKERYIGNTSYVDEYIPDYRGGRRYYGDTAGCVLATPGIHFVDPASERIDLSKFRGTAIVGLGGLQGSSETSTLFVHQVRAVKGGSEMRSRFYRGSAKRTNVGHADSERAKALNSRLPIRPSGLPPAGFGMLHLGQEMNHLARFLPALYEEFRLDRKHRRRGTST